MYATTCHTTKTNSCKTQEASTGQVNLNEENPTCVDLALKYIYGGGKQQTSHDTDFLNLTHELEFDVVSFIPDDHFIEHCVSLWRTADFLLLNKLKSPVEKAVHSYCDKKMKQICTYGSPPTWSNLFNRKKLTPWALDVVLGLRCTYKWNIEHLKAVLMEFIWIARTWVLTPILISTLNDHFKDVPAFKDDLLCKYASASWNKTAVWAPRITNDITTDGGRFRVCLQCTKTIPRIGSQEREGCVVDPFSLDIDRNVTRGWCKDCGKLDMIPWRTYYR